MLPERLQRRCSHAFLFYFEQIQVTELRVVTELSVDVGRLFRIKYSRIDQVKFADNSL